MRHEKAPTPGRGAGSVPKTTVFDTGYKQPHQGGAVALVGKGPIDELAHTGHYLHQIQDEGTLPREGITLIRPEDLGFGELFERIRDAVIVADPATQRIVLWNPAATSIFGYSPSEALGGMRVEDLVPERFKAQHRAGMARYRETGRGRYIDANKLLDLPALAKSGEEIRVELSLSPIASKDGNAGAYVLAIVRDVTMRNRAEEYAAQLLRHLSGEPMSEPYTTLPDVSSEPRASLQEAHTVELTARELEVLRLLALGKTNRQIAQEMLVSVSSVKAYVGRVTKKLGVCDRTQAAVRAVEFGLLPEQQE